MVVLELELWTNFTRDSDTSSYHGTCRHSLLINFHHLTTQKSTLSYLRIARKISHKISLAERLSRDKCLKCLKEDLINKSSSWLNVKVSDELIGCKLYVNESQTRSRRQYYCAVRVAQRSKQSTTVPLNSEQREVKYRGNDRKLSCGRLNCGGQILRWRGKQGQVHKTHSCLESTATTYCKNQKTTNHSQG